MKNLLANTLQRAYCTHGVRCVTMPISICLKAILVTATSLRIWTEAAAARNRNRLFALEYHLARNAQQVARREDNVRMKMFIL